MNQTPQFPISDELLSAYIDGDATDAEKQHIEFAIANDPDIAWQVETLRQTVAFLRDLPMIPAPRSFVLEEAQVADVLAIRRQQHVNPTEPTASSGSIWQQLLAFFSGGNLALRNASAIAAALFVVVTVSRTYLAQGPIMPRFAQPEAAMIEVASAPEEPAAEAPAGDAALVAPESGQREDAVPAPMAVPEPVDTSASLPGQDSGTTAEPDMQAMTLQTAPSEGQDSPAPQAATASEQPLMADVAESPADVEAARDIPFDEDSANNSREQAPPAVETFSIAGAAVAEEPAEMDAAAAESAIAESADAETAEITAAEAPAMARVAPAPTEAAPSSDAAGEETTTADIAMAQSAIPASEEGAVADTADVAEEAEVVEENFVADTEEAEIEPEVETEVEADMTAFDAPESTLAAESAPQDDTVSAAKSGDPAVSRMVTEDVASTAPSSAQEGASWNVWQTMQVGLLSLALILSLLWLGSRRRV